MATLCQKIIQLTEEFEAKYLKKVEIMILKIVFKKDSLNYKRVLNSMIRFAFLIQKMGNQ